MVESALMAKIPGKLMVDMLPDGKVRLVFLASNGDRRASPVTVEDLYAAEDLFLMCGLSKEHAAALRAEVKRNRVAAVDTSVEEDVATKFRRVIPPA
jgi:hypothetical protein